MPAKRKEVAKEEVKAAPVSAVPKPVAPEESYQVIKRGDAYVVEVTLYGRTMHDHRTFPYFHDAVRRMEELSKHLK